MKLPSIVTLGFAASLLLFTASSSSAQKKHKKSGDDYTPCTAKVNKESHVWVIVTVNPKGKVTGATVAKSSGDECLDRKGLSMARQQSYPALVKRVDDSFQSGRQPDRKFNVDLKVKPDAFASAGTPKPDDSSDQ
jgi:TonB family protein